MPWPTSSAPGRAQTNTQTGSSQTYRYKLATGITKQLCKAGLSHFPSAQPLCGYSFFCHLKRSEQREGNIAGGNKRARESERAGRQEPDDCGVNEDTKCKNQRFHFGTKAGEGSSAPFAALLTRCQPQLSGVKKTHQGFVCSVRVN